MKIGKIVGLMKLLVISGPYQYILAVPLMYLITWLCVYHTVVLPASAIADIHEIEFELSYLCFECYPRL